MLTIFKRWMLVVVAATALAVPAAGLAFEFKADDTYASTGQALLRFSPQGTLLETLDISGVEARGIAFGNPHLLYVVRNNDASADQKASVEVINRRGRVLRTYSFDGWIGGLATAGTIHFDPTGQIFYVSALDGVYRFHVAGTHGQLIINTAAITMTVLPQGDLLVSDGSVLRRYSAAGALLSSVATIRDPLGLTKDITDGPPMLVDVRGIAYDARTDTTLVTMLGYSGGSQTAMNFKILAFQGFSEVLKGISDYWYGAQMVVSPDGRLLVGSAAQAPGVFDLGRGLPLAISLSGTLGTSSAMFLTVAPGPR